MTAPLLAELEARRARLFERLAPVPLSQDQHWSPPNRAGTPVTNATYGKPPCNP